MEQAVESDLARQLNKIIIEDINRQIVEGEPKPTEATQPEPPLYYKPNRHDRRAAAARARKQKGKKK